MSTTTLERAGESAPAVPRHQRNRGVTGLGVLRSEWVKLRSVRSSTVTLASAAAALLSVGLIFSAILGGILSTGESPDEFGGDPAGAALSGVTIAQLIIGVLGVLLITSEYGTGMIRGTLTAVPSRLPVLWAKAAVLTIATLPLMVVTALVTFLVGQSLIGTNGLDTATLGDPGVLRAVLATGAYLTGVALIGLAVGTLLRSTAAAISTLFAMVFLLPGLGSVLLPASWRDDVLQLLPSNAGSAFMSVQPGPELLSAGAGAAVFAAWIVVPFVAAAVALKRRSV